MSKSYSIMHINKQWVRPPQGEWQAFILFWSAVILLKLIYPYILPEATEPFKVLQVADTFACFFFFIDVLWRWCASTDKIGFWKWGWIDLISSIPYLTIFRYGRVLSIIRIIRQARSSERMAAFFFSNRFNGTFLLAASMLCASIIIAAVVILHIEKEAPNANIKTYFDAIWWAIGTVSTVGYGDVYPITDGGRIVGMVLMLCGIGLFSVNAALISSWLITEIKWRNPENAKAQNKSSDFCASKNFRCSKKSK